MTKSQAKRVIAIAKRIEALADKASAIFGDDPMAGEVWTDFNHISAAAQNAVMHLEAEA